VSASALPQQYLAFGFQLGDLGIVLGFQLQDLGVGAALQVLRFLLDTGHHLRRFGLHLGHALLNRLLLALDQGIALGQCLLGLAGNLGFDSQLAVAFFLEKASGMMMLRMKAECTITFCFAQADFSSVSKSL